MKSTALSTVNITLVKGITEDSVSIHFAGNGIANLHNCKDPARPAKSSLQFSGGSYKYKITNNSKINIKKNQKYFFNCFVQTEVTFNQIRINMKKDMIFKKNSLFQ